ncbi:MAG: hypothetical protein LAT62_08210 [Natronospirillum sp.]|nr:hypothetical protein [Natronospirillum sp.]
MRGKTSHTCDEKIALEVVREIPEFLEEAQYLHEMMTQRVCSGWPTE